ncbi:DUF4192 family protein [Arthrobacter sp. MP_2.3]|uniref:DUF4192 family protein n=1 Tax=Arthrobacter sp. MP_2.3 TaxID=3349633 RepID=UPI0038D454EB
MTDKTLSLTTHADLLATVPHLLGYTPTESFVIITANGGAVGMALRAFAPSETSPVEYAQMMATYAAEDDAATAAYVIVYSEETATGAEVHPYAAHVGALAKELATAQMPVRNVWMVTGTYWAEFGTTDRKPLDAITESAANATLIFRGSAPDMDVYAPALLGHWALRVQAPEGTEEDITAACGAWEVALNDPAMPDADTARTLAAAFQHKNIRDHLMRATIVTNDEGFAEIMLGKLTYIPNWDRIDYAEAILFELMKAVPAGQRAPMLTMMGWIQWLKGRTTQGTRYLRQAIEDVEEFRLARLLLELINRGAIADLTRDATKRYNGFTR